MESQEGAMRSVSKVKVSQLIYGPKADVLKSDIKMYVQVKLFLKHFQVK